MIDDNDDIAYSTYIYAKWAVGAIFESCQSRPSYEISVVNYYCIWDGYRPI